MEPKADTLPPAGIIDTLYRSWPFIVCGVTLISGWVHFQSNLADLSNQVSSQATRLSTVEVAAQTANVDNATLQGAINTANGKLDILLKADHLE